jgi:thymidylate synthase
MERYWPKRAGDMTHHVEDDDHARPIHGIRYEYGDLKDVWDLLYNEPGTRQAYLPVWFPEDTGVLHGGRVPCTLGYHFIMRNKQLHIVYNMRACDAIRHFRNDVYLTMRLAHWMLDQLRKRGGMWDLVSLGTLTMHITSFHVFMKEKNLL